MIFGNVGNLKEFSFLEDSVKKCFEYLESHKLLFFEKGSYEIDGDRLFVNVAEYETTAPENRFWEAHKDYLDVHVMLRGEEQIDVNFIGNMHLEEYVKKDDFLPMEGEKNGSVVLRPGDFLVCYPNDGHRTGVAAEKPVLLKKAIFKVLICQ